MTGVDVATTALIGVDVRTGIDVGCVVDMKLEIMRPSKEPFVGVGSKVDVDTGSVRVLWGTTDVAVEFVAVIAAWIVLKAKVETIGRGVGWAGKNDLTIR